MEPHTQLLAALVELYENAAQQLRDYRSAHFRRGDFVEINDPRYKGFAVVSFVDGDCPPTQLPVMLANGVVWRYRLASVVRTVNPDEVPRSLRRAWLRNNGYRLLGA